MYFFFRLYALISQGGKKYEKEANELGQLDRLMRVGRKANQSPVSSAPKAALRIFGLDENGGAFSHATRFFV